MSTTHKSQRNQGHDVLRKKLKRVTKLDAFESVIKDILQKHPSITGGRLHEKLKETGYVGGISILRERLKILSGTAAFVVTPINYDGP